MIGAPATGAILAGGKSRRFGSDKAQARLFGERFVERELAVLAGFCRELLIVGGRPEDFNELDARHVSDLHPGTGPLGGLATALSAASHDRILLVACDLPLLSPGTVSALLERFGDADVVIARGPEGLEPLCAVYARRCLDAVERALGRGDRDMRCFHHELSVQEISFNQLPDPASFTNVNCRADLENLEARAEYLDERATRVVQRLGALSEEPMRLQVLLELLLTMGPAEAAEVLHRLLTPDGPRQGKRAIAAATCARFFAGGETLPYGLAADIYGIANARRYEAVQRLLLQPAARRSAGEGELTPDPRVSDRTLGERKSMARRNDPDLIDRLLYDPDPEVVSRLLANPRLTEREAVRLASRRPAAPEALRLLARSPRFGRRVAVQRALARNPYTPTDLATNLLTFLTAKDLREIQADAALHAGVRMAAESILRARVSSA